GGDRAELLDGRVVEIDHNTREMFGATDMFVQRKKLLQTLGFAVSSLDNLDVLMSMLQDLGRRHVGYGVTAKQYESVGVALLWALERRLGCMYAGRGSGMVRWLPIIVSGEGWWTGE